MEHQLHWYASHLPAKGQQIADVGANVGRLSQFFWEQGARTSTVTSIEPLRENASAIEARIRAARPGSKWTLKRCAISSHDGHLTMRVLRANGGLNGMVVAAGSTETITVACRRLESLVPDATVVKVDVEGHEYAFLPQAVAAMSKVTAWALELHGVDGHRLEDTLSLFASHGFKLIGAGAAKSDPGGPWVDIDVTPGWTWASIPGVPSLRDGLPSTFKMLHLLALR